MKQLINFSLILTVVYPIFWLSSHSEIPLINIAITNQWVLNLFLIQLLKKKSNIYLTTCHEIHDQDVVESVRAGRASSGIGSNPAYS